jgi:hypothetical protein
MSALFIAMWVLWVLLGIVLGLNLGRMICRNGGDDARVDPDTLTGCADDEMLAAIPISVLRAASGRKGGDANDAQTTAGDK